MASVFKGAINFGLINIPISMDLAVTKDDISFRMLHRECGNPVEYKRYCPHCEKEITMKEIAKGYEYQKGKFVIIEKEELSTLSKKENKNIEIINFIKLVEIDPIFFEKAYYLNAEKSGSKAYQLLLSAMEKTKRVAIGKITIRDKEHLCVIRTYKNTLSLSTMFFPAEIKAVSEKKAEHKITEAELKMAKELVEKLTEDFKPENYVNEYNKEVMKILNKKIKKKEFRVISNSNITGDKETISLFEKLKQSIEKTKQVG